MRKRREEKLKRVCYYIKCGKPIKRNPVQYVTDNGRFVVVHLSCWFKLTHQKNETVEGDK